MITLSKNKGYARFEFKKARVHKNVLLEILRFGIPSGIQTSLFSISNVIIQSTINDFGKDTVAACTASSQLEGFVYTVMDAVASATVTAVGQNYGAQKYERIKKTVIYCCLFTTAASFVAAGIELIFHNQLISLYVKNDEQAKMAFERLVIMIVPYFTCGIMNVVNCAIRGIGYSFTPMIIVLVGTCVFRLIWIYCIFPLDPVVTSVYLSYPISWVITALAGGLTFALLYKKRKKQLAADELLNAHAE